MEPNDKRDAEDGEAGAMSGPSAPDHCKLKTLTQSEQHPKMDFLFALGGKRRQRHSIDTQMVLNIVLVLSVFGFRTQTEHNDVGEAFRRYFLSYRLSIIQTGNHVLFMDTKFTM